MFSNDILDEKIVPKAVILRLLSTTVYAVAAGTYAFYSFNVIMYGAILSLGVAVLYFYLVVRNCQSNRRDATRSQIAFYRAFRFLAAVKDLATASSRHCGRGLSVG